MSGKEAVLVLFSIWVEETVKVRLAKKRVYKLCSVPLVVASEREWAVGGKEAVLKSYPLFWVS